MDRPLVVLCPGQGSQAVGMARAWREASQEARRVFERADEVLGTALGARVSELCFEGPQDRLNRTDISQPAIYTASVACWRGLLARWSFGNGEAALAGAAGLSLGEYTALHIAGVFSFEDGLELVAVRGRAMQEAAESQAGGMVALIGADDGAAERVCEEARESDVLVCANYNAPGQVVLSGHKAACERAAKAAGARGLRAAMLPVAGAFHSPLMAPAARKLGEALAGTAIGEPRCVVVSNVTARAHGPGEGSTMAEEVRRLLAEQLTSPVRWSESCRWMVSSLRGEFHELCPGTALAGLMRRIDRGIKVINHDQPNET